MRVIRGTRSNLDAADVCNKESDKEGSKPSGVSRLNRRGMGGMLWEESKASFTDSSQRNTRKTLGIFTIYTCSKILGKVFVLNLFSHAMASCEEQARNTCGKEQSSRWR